MQKSTNNLFEIVQKSTNVLQQIIENNGELTEELEQALANVQLQYAEKIDGYQYFMERIDLESEYFEDKAAKYYKIAASLELLKSKLKENIKQSMRMLDYKEALGNDTKFKLVNGKSKLVIDENLLEPKWVMEVKTLVPDKDRIRAALEQGIEVRGAYLEDVYQLRSYANKKMDRS